MSDLVGGALGALEAAGCVTIGGGGGDGDSEEDSVTPTAVGRIASFYYLDHTTLDKFTRGLGPDLDVEEILQVD